MYYLSRITDMETCSSHRLDEQDNKIKELTAELDYSTKTRPRTSTDQEKKMQRNFHIMEHKSLYESASKLESP